METKLVFALCALLVTNLESAERADHKHTAPSTSANNTEGAPMAPGASSLNFTSQPAPALNDSGTNPSSNGTGSLNSNTTAGGEPTPLKPKATKNNDTNILLPDINRNLTEKLPTQLPQEGPANTSHVLPTSAPASPPHTAHAAPVNATNTIVATGTAAPVSQQPLRPETSFTASAPNQTEPARPKTGTTTTVSARSPSAPPQERPSPEVQTHVDATQAQTEPGISTPGGPAVHTKAHANTPSQLNVGGDGGSTMVHASPTLDPLLAGLVSAFIITAVIITLLLFLKLRRRDNRPEFRRLQDLPMDDMMEDTPLSMYTY